MTKQLISLERKLLEQALKKWPKPLHEQFAEPGFRGIPTERMKKRQNEEKRLFEVLSLLPHWGIGRLVVSVDDFSRQDPCFWRITRVFVDTKAPKLDYGLAYGIYTEDGYCKGYEKEIEYTNEEFWRLVPRSEEDKFLSFQPQEKALKELPLYVRNPPLLERMIIADHHKLTGEKLADGEIPMVRMLIHRQRKLTARQRLDDGSLV